MLSYSLHAYSFMASVSPSPTVSMLRVTRVSRCSFLFSLSMATVSRSSGEGFNTLPPHSTYKTRGQTGQRVDPRRAFKCLAWRPYVVDGDDPPFPQQEKGLLVVVVIVHLVGIDEDEVERFSLAARQKVIWSRRWRTCSVSVNRLLDGKSWLLFCTCIMRKTWLYLEFSMLAECAGWFSSPLQPVSKDSGALERKCVANTH